MEVIIYILPFIFVFLIQIIMIEINAIDTEYLGSYVTRITYYEECDE